MSNTATPAGLFQDQHDNDFEYRTDGDGLFTVESDTERIAVVMSGAELDEAGIELHAVVEHRDGTEPDAEDV